MATVSNYKTIGQLGPVTADMEDAGSSAPRCCAVNGDIYNGIEWLACWLLDHAEGETITEEQLRPWAVDAWKEHLLAIMNRRTKMTDAEWEKREHDMAAAWARCADEADSLKDALEALLATLDERGLPFDTVAFRAACDTARSLIANDKRDGRL